MQEAQSMSPANPKTYVDMLLVWSIVSGYSAVEPDRAFPILDDAIVRLNDTISALVKVGEFIDVGGEMIDDGEIRVGTIGGGMGKQILGSLGQFSGPTIGNLAMADFEKLRNSVNRFDRPEVRVLAKALILRAVAKSSGMEGDTTETDEDISLGGLV